MKTFSCLLFLVFFGTIYSQKKVKNDYELKEIFSTFTFKKNEKNLFKRDSLILYKDKTFYKSNLNVHYDEISGNNYYGDWKLLKDKLYLEIKRCDSCKKFYMESQIIYRVKKDELVPSDPKNEILKSYVK